MLCCDLCGRAISTYVKTPDGDCICRDCWPDYREPRIIPLPAVLRVPLPQGVIDAALRQVAAGEEP